MAGYYCNFRASTPRLLVIDAVMSAGVGVLMIGIIGDKSIGNEPVGNGIV